MAHRAELIAVGTELLLGNIANTNAQEISQTLSGLGVNVYWHTVVGDNPGRLREALNIARGRADLILTTGGLGPTCDDLTKQIKFTIDFSSKEPTAVDNINADVVAVKRIEDGQLIINVNGVRYNAVGATIR